MGVSAQDWLDAQHGVLGSVLISPELAPQVLAETSEQDYSGQCLAVYQAIRHLFSAGQPIDVVTIRDCLGADSSKFLLQLMEITPTAANYKTYIALCRKQSRISRIQSIAMRMMDAESLEQIQQCLEQAAAISAGEQGIRAIPIREAFLRFVDRRLAEKKPEYISWPIRDMDKLLYVEPGDFVILGGKPSAGKTAFALQCAWHMAESKRVGFFSLETGEEKLADRQFSSAAEIPLENIKLNALSEAHWDSVRQIDAATIRRNLDYIPVHNVSVADLHAFSAAKGYDVIFVDYIQLLKGHGASRYEEVTNLSIDLHRFSRATGCCVIGLSQLSRQGGDAAPDMSALRESGQLEQDADAVLLLYLEKPDDPKSRRILKCAKNKEGERFRTLLDFDGKYQRFSKASDPGGVYRAMQQMSKEARQQRQLAKMQQMTMLPPDTEVPEEFTKGASVG